MADIRLAKPVAGTTQTVPSAPDGRFIFDFPADAATLTRNGDDLVLTFEDGAAIQLQGFYTTYSKEEMPSFQVDGVEISGQDFFAALDEDLMPAAGPASGSSAARGGRYNEYGGSDLLDGLDHLGRLDIGFDGGTQLATDTVEPSPYSEVDHGVTVTPSGVGAATEVVTVYEAGLAGGSQAGEKDAPTMAGGSLSINAPDGVASIVIGGVVVFENGALTGKGVSTDEGTLSVTGYDPATGKLDFSYSLDRNTTEHVKSDPDTDTQISHTLVVTVTDTDGDSGSTTITVNVVDDAPTAVDDTVIGEEAQAQQGVVGDVLENDKTGADGLPNAVTSVKHGDEGSMAGSALKGAYGELTLNADGTYTYKLDKNVDVEKGKSVTETFTYTITDADGDTSEATLTITIRGDEKEPVAPGEDKAEIVVDEGALSDGSGQHAELGILGKDSFTVNLNGEDGTVTLKYGSGEDTSTITLSLINGENFTSQWLSENKTLTVNGVKVTVTDATQETPGGPWKIEYTYELTGQQAHKNAGSAGAVGEKDPLSDSIDITVTDATGDMTTGSLMVTVHDDGPVLTAFWMDAQSSDTDSSIHGQLDFVFGADAAGATLTVEVGGTTFTGTKHGSEWTFTSQNAKPGEDFRMNADGIFTYSRPTADVQDHKADSYTFNVTVTDGDGDSVSQSMTVTTTEVEPDVSDHTDLVVNEDGLVHDNNSETATGQLVVDLHGQSGTVTIGSVTVTVAADGTVSLPKDVVAEGSYGNLTITNVDTADGKTTIDYSYTLDTLYTHKDDEGNPTSEVKNGDTFKVQVNEKDTGTITVDIIDDVPTLTVETSSVEDQELPKDNLGSGKDVDFVFEETAANTENAGNEVQENILSQNNKDWENVTIYAAHVNYEKLNDDGYAIDDDGIQNKDNYHLEYSLYPNKGKNPADFGLMVRNEGMDFPQSQDGANGFETNAFVDANGNLTGSEAIVIDLGDKTAYGVSLDFGAFYSNFKGNEGQEHVLITFYKDDEPIGSRVIDAIQNEGGQAVVVHSDQFLSAGFDKVVISALQNTGGTGQASTFTLQGVGLITAPEPIRQVTGEITVASGADGYHAETGEDGTTTSNDFTQAHVRFDMPETLTIETEDGSVKLTLEIRTDSAGNSLLTGSADGKEYFSVILEQQEDGSWSWKMDQYEEFLVWGEDGQLGNLELGFITMDGDDDTATETVNIPLKNLPDLAVSQTTLVTDESYINGLGSETGPAEGGDGQATSNEASGTLNVKTYGKKGTLTLTINSKDHTFQLDADGKLAENHLTVETTYGTLTLANGEAGKITYTYTQTKPYHHDPDSEPDQLTDAESFTVTVKDADGNRSGEKTITVSIEDDAPMFSDESFTVDVANESEKYWSYAQEISFTGNEIANHFDGKNEVTMQYGDNKLTLQVGKIQFEADGNIDTSKDCATFIDGQGTFHINGGDKEHGIGVHSKYEGGADNSLIYQYQFNRQNEIGYDPISKQSEAVIIHLDKPAVNMNIDLSLFFSAVGSDTNPEKAIFLFYKDGEYVGKSHLSSDEASGDVQQNGFSALPPGGFDTVVIAAGDNGTDPTTVWDNSEFNISAITFNKFEGVDRTLTGKLDATSADGIKGYSVDTDKLANLELTSSISYDWDADTGMLLATAGKETVFELVLNTETGAWTMVQYKEYEGNLELPFTATDGDDDSTSISVEIPATGAESGTYKVTDSDAEKAVLAAAEQEMKSAVRSGEALATAAVLAGMATVLPDEVPAVEGDRPDTPDETLVAAPAEAADAPAALSFVEEGAALPDSPVDGMDDTPLLFANLALAGQEELMVSAVQTDAADGPLWADASGTDDTSGTVVGETATAGPGAAHPGTAAPEAVLHGTDGDDILLGGDGDELIFGGSGDDFIDGGAGRDTIYAGAGNDIIVYDQQDYLVSGGSGIDFMVSDDTSLTLDGLLSNTSSDKPLVSGIEVLLKGEDALSLTSINDLADRYGITLGVNEAGEETLQLDDRWTKQDDGSYDFNGGAEADGGLTLETSLTPVETGDPASEAVQQQVFTLEHSNG